MKLIGLLEGRLLNVKCCGDLPLGFTKVPLRKKTFSLPWNFKTWTLSHFLPVSHIKWYTAKNAVISLDFLMWNFVGRHSFHTRKSGKITVFFAVITLIIVNIISALNFITVVIFFFFLTYISTRRIWYKASGEDIFQR